MATYTIKKYTKDEVITEVAITGGKIQLRAPGTTWVILKDGIPYTSNVSGKNQLEMYSRKATAVQECAFLNTQV